MHCITISRHRASTQVSFSMLVSENMCRVASIRKLMKVSMNTNDDG